MALTIYGSSQSRTLRTLWAAAELDRTFEDVPLTWNDAYLETEAFLALNPAGAIPTIVDDGVVVAESMAINLYLAGRCGRNGATPLLPHSPSIEAPILQWSFWAQGHLEPWIQRDARLSPLLHDRPGLIGEEIARHLALLSTILTKNAWLATEHFTVGNLNVAGVLSPSRAAALPLTAFPAVRDWLRRCYGHPKAQYVRRRYAEP